MPAARARLIDRRLARQGGAVAVVLALLIILGCLSIGPSIDCKPAADTDGTFHQEGTIRLQAGEERDVYFPVPYVTPPYLELSDTASCQLLSQQPTHFRIHNPDQLARSVEWKARGVKGKVVQTIAPAPPAPALPPAPVPVGPDEPPGSAR